jgi:hypothetical protein
MPDAVNARVAQVVEFHRDERGASLFRRLAGAHAPGLRGQATAPVVDTRGATWHGRIHASPQQFRGVANIGTAPISERSPELGDTRSAGLEDPAQRLFRERAARRRR